MCGTLFPRVLVHLVSLNHRALQPPLILELPGEVREPVPQAEQFHVVGSTATTDSGVARLQQAIGDLRVVR